MSSQSLQYVRSIRDDTYWQILLVGEDKEKSITKLVLVEHALQLLTSLDNTVTIIGVDDEDDTLGVLEVMSPQRTDLVLSTDIPDCELDVLVFDSLDVETYFSQTKTCKPMLLVVLAFLAGILRAVVIGCRDVPMVGMVVTISPSLSL